MGVKYHFVCVCLFVFFSHVQEAKMLIAKAYRHTEKLLLDNRDKLILVRSKIVKIFLRKKLRNVKIQQDYVDLAEDSLINSMKTTLKTMLLSCR